MEATEAIIHSVDHAAIKLSKQSSPKSLKRKRSLTINMEKFTVSVNDLNRQKPIDWLHLEEGVLINMFHRLINRGFY